MQNENSQKFYHETGRFSELEITNKKKIAEGAFGDIYECTIELPYEVEGNIKKKEVQMIIKDFKKENAVDPWFGVTDGRASTTEEAEMHAENAFKKYSALKKIGLKLFTTYRLSEDKTKILMTNGNNNTTICLDVSNTLHLENKLDLTSISNLSSLTSDMLKNAEQAALNRIRIPSIDSFFFLVNKSDTSQIDFVMGDLDLLPETGENEHLMRKAVIENIISTVVALVVFIKKFVKKDSDGLLIKDGLKYVDTVMEMGGKAIEQFFKKKYDYSDSIDILNEMKMEIYHSFLNPASTKMNFMEDWGALIKKYFLKEKQNL